MGIGRATRNVADIDRHFFYRRRNRCRRFILHIGDTHDLIAVIRHAFCIRQMLMTEAIKSTAMLMLSNTFFSLILCS